MDSLHHGFKQLNLASSIQIDVESEPFQDGETGGWQREFRGPVEINRPFSKGLKLFIVQENEQGALPPESSKKIKSPMLHSAFSMKINEMNISQQTSQGSYNDYLRKKKIDLNNKADSDVK